MKRFPKENEEEAEVNGVKLKMTLKAFKMI